MIESKMDLLAIRNSGIIRDPFPEHSAYEMTMKLLEENESFIGKLFGLGNWINRKIIPKPKPINIHDAYMRGYNQAYAEIQDAIEMDRRR